MPSINHTGRGRLISLEGLNGVGKTYLTTRVVTAADHSQPPLVVEGFSRRSDSDSDLGRRLLRTLVTASHGERFLRAGFPKSETLLLLAIKMHDFETTLPALRAGRTVIEGRSIHSTAVYQSLIMKPDDDVAALTLARRILDTLDHLTDIETSLGAMLPVVDLVGTENLTIDRGHGRQRFHYRWPFPEITALFARHGCRRAAWPADRHRRVIRRARSSTGAKTRPLRSTVGLDNRKGRMVKRYDVEIGALLSTGAARRALRKRSVVQVYRLLVEGGISRDLIAELTGQHVSEVAEILAGKEVDDYDMLVRIAAGLGLHRAAMGVSFRDDALDYGPNVAAPPDPVTEDWGDSPLPFWVEETDVAGLEGTTARLRDLDRRYGSHWAFLKVVAAHAQYSERLLSSAYTGKTRRRLALAVCDAYSLAGWVALDVSRRRPAWDHFQRSLLFGWAAQDEVAVMGAIQSVGRLDLHEAPDFALKVFQLAQLNGSSAITQAFLKADEGWAAALLGQTEDASYAIQRAKAMFEDSDPDSARPSWMDPAQALPDLLSVTGAAQLQLGNLSEAVADLSRALAGRPEAATRSRATDGAALATAYLRAGEVELGLSTGHQAVDAVRHMPSARVRDGLARLQLELVGRSDIPSRELAERVAGLPTWKMARRLGLSRSLLQSYVEYGLIEPDLVMPGGHYRFDPKHVRQQLQQLRDRGYVVGMP